MLSPELVKMLNDQINLEFYSSNVYLQMAAWCEYKGMPGTGRFLRDHANEEMAHMQRLFDYVCETGSLAVLGAIEQPRIEYEHVAQMFEIIYEHEKLVTRKINELVDAAFASKDYSTFNFLQWYVAEQHEEEHLFSGILDRIRLIGTEGRGMFHIDRELEQMIGAKV